MQITNLQSTFCSIPLSENYCNVVLFQRGHYSGRKTELGQAHTLWICSDRSLTTLGCSFPLCFSTGLLSRLCWSTPFSQGQPGLFHCHTLIRGLSTLKCLFFAPTQVLCTLQDPYPSLNQGLANFSAKSQIVNTLGFAAHSGSVATAQLCCCSRKAAIDNMKTDEHGHPAIKPYLQIQKAGQIWP